ncbi:hypothetical protein KC19_1G199900 [Ceratodon purpureus]|uniref:Uncharacterized protein n=1 Tax=Ceratodon purpureus TaxID=3225 RepID=A0A8T0J9E4_CERPU|nr:hypothetical protein KC19_1G199900 [Ceratodon purpureus]
MDVSSREMIMEHRTEVERFLMTVSRMIFTWFFLGCVVGAAAERPFTCPNSAVFVFGDSLTDTGNIASLGLDILRYPYGMSYTIPGSINPSRFSDGRLIIDFFAQAFGFPFIEPVTAKLIAGRRSGYERGANFAYGGATAAINLLASPFNLPLEVLEFLSFRTTSTIPHADPSYFGRALYVMSEIGANDFIHAYSKGLTPSQATKLTVPRAIKAVRLAMETLYASGSRSFLFFNAPPAGCTPYILTLYGRNDSPVDRSGCMIEYNEVVKVYNAQLKAMVTEFRTLWSDVSILFFDSYSATKAIFSDLEAYGFQKEKALVACCGYGGQHNFNPSVGCGKSGEVVDPVTNVSTFVNISSACANPSQYLIWDGLHPTQALNRQLARFFLNGRFVEGPAQSSNLSLQCNLNLSNF